MLFLVAKFWIEQKLRVHEAPVQNHYTKSLMALLWELSWDNQKPRMPFIYLVLIRMIIVCLVVNLKLQVASLAACFSIQWMLIGKRAQEERRTAGNPNSQILFKIFGDCDVWTILSSILLYKNIFDGLTFRLLPKYGSNTSRICIIKRISVINEPRAITYYYFYWTKKY